MSGSEWFTTRPGGLNRYFESLFLALSKEEAVDVEGSAFGAAPLGGLSWGDPSGNLLERHRASARTKVAPDVLLDRHFAPYGPGPLAWRSANPLVVHFQGPWHGESRAAGHSLPSVALKWMIEAARYRPADHAIVLCKEFGRILHTSLRFPSEKISVIPPGVDLDRFVATPVPSSPRPLVLCVRRLERRMGIDVLLDSWSDVLQRHPEARLAIVGEGSEGASLRQQSTDLGLNASVEFEGRVDDDQLAGLYQAAALTVVPSRTLEGFGLIALESLASGRAAVVTDTGGLPDAVGGLDPTLIVASGDRDALASRLSEAIAGKVPTPLECRAHSEAFTWTEVARRHVDLYESLT